MKNKIWIYLTCMLLVIISIVAVIMGTNYIVEVHQDDTKTANFNQLSIEEIIEHTDKPYTGPEPDTLPDIDEPTGDVSDLEKAMEAQGLSKAHWLAQMYYELAGKYPDDFICGLLGCFCAEGTPGQIESLFYSTAGDGRILHDECPFMDASWRAKKNREHVYWYPKHKTNNICFVHEFQVRPEGRYVKSSSDIDTLLKLPDGSNQPGIGLAQWSGSRRRTLLNLYKTVCQGDYSEESLFKAEVEMVKTELEGSYRGVVGRCQSEGCYNVNSEDSTVLACKWIFTTYEYGKSNISEVDPQYWTARVPGAQACWRAVQAVKGGS